MLIFSNKTTSRYFIKVKSDDFIKANIEREICFKIIFLCHFGKITLFISFWSEKYLTVTMGAHEKWVLVASVVLILLGREIEAQLWPQVPLWDIYFSNQVSF